VAPEGGGIRRRTNPVWKKAKCGAESSLKGCSMGGRDSRKGESAADVVAEGDWTSVEWLRGRGRRTTRLLRGGKELHGRFWVSFPMGFQ